VLLSLSKGVVLCSRILECPASVGIFSDISIS
jgi:hypothetical protein